MEACGHELIEHSEKQTVMRMPVEGNRQPLGLLHGGATIALCETAGSVAAQGVAGPDKWAVGLEVNATHHRSAREGYVTATATVLNASRNFVTCSVSVHDDGGKLISTVRLTCALIDRNR